MMRFLFSSADHEGNICQNLWFVDQFENAGLRLMARTSQGVRGREGTIGTSLGSRASSSCGLYFLDFGVPRPQCSIVREKTVRGRGDRNAVEIIIVTVLLPLIAIESND